MKNPTVKGAKKFASGNTDNNILAYLMKQNIREQVNTAEVVCIDNADQSGTDGTAGYATATPMVCQTDGYNNVLPSTPIAHLPYLRPQAGKAAIVMDPQPGDKAILVAMKRDSSNVTTSEKTPVHPGSFRTFSKADGYLINGFLGEAPEIWLHLNPVSGDISLSTKAANIDISCRESGDIDIVTNAGNVAISAKGDVGVEASGEIYQKAPQIILDGNVRVTGNISVEGKSTGPNGGPAVFSSGIVNENGGFSNSGGIENSGGVTRSNNVTVEGHTHIGDSGGKTQPPNKGS